MFPALLLPRASDEREAPTHDHLQLKHRGEKGPASTTGPGALLGEVLWGIYGHYW